MASQPRKAGAVTLAKTTGVQLQWGRGFAATEGALERVVMCGAGTLQWGRGFAATEGKAAVEEDRSTPALLQWGRGFAATEGSYVVTELFNAVMLHWGRGFAATEGAVRTLPPLRIT